MAKLTLSDVSNPENGTSYSATINNNSGLIEAAIENTLSRDGTSPNAMESDFDMNSNRILNLPLAVQDTEPVRKGEFDVLATGLEDLTSAVADAQAAQAAAEAAQAGAENAQVDAETASTIAEGFANDADASAAAAALSETNAGTSETNAAASEAAALAAQAAAELAETNAETAEANAELAEVNAETAEANAEAARDAALAAQAAAEAARDEAEIAADNFDDVYLGSKSSDPTLDNDGNPLVAGQLYFNTISDSLKAYDGATWLNYTAATGITQVADDTSPTLGGNLDVGAFTVGDATAADLTKLNDLTATSTELNYVDGVTSAIQTQIDGKQPLDADLTSWAGVTRASGFDTFVTTPSSANLDALVTDDTGSGALVFATSPTLVTPILGTPTSGTLTNCTGLPAAGVTGTALTATVADQTITGGANITLLNHGTVSSGTHTPDPGDRPFQFYTNGGAHTLAEMSAEGSCIYQILNNASAGAITTSGWDVVFGAFTTTNGHRFRVAMERFGTFSTLYITRLL